MLKRLWANHRNACLITLAILVTSMIVSPWVLLVAVLPVGWVLINKNRAEGISTPNKDSKFIPEITSSTDQNQISTNKRLETLNKLYESFLQCLENIDDDDGSNYIYATFDEVIDTEHEFIRKSDIGNIEEFEDESISERLTSGDYHTHSMNFNGSLKLTYNYGIELLTITEEDLIDSGILEFQKANERKPNDAYLEAGRYYLGSEEWSYELSKINDFDIRKLKVIVRKINILNEEINIIWEVIYDKKEIELEIEDSGLDCYFKGVQLVDRDDNNSLETIFYLENEDFENNEKLYTNISKWICNKEYNSLKNQSNLNNNTYENKILSINQPIKNLRATKEKVIRITFSGNGGEFTADTIHDEELVDLIKRKIDNGGMSSYCELDNGDYFDAVMYDSFFHIYGVDIPNSNLLIEFSTADKDQDDIENIEFEEIFEGSVEDSNINTFQFSCPWTYDQIKEGGLSIQTSNYQEITDIYILKIEENCDFDLKDIYAGFMLMDESFFTNDQILEKLLYIPKQKLEIIFDDYVKQWPESKGSFEAQNDEERREIMAEWLEDGLFKDNFVDNLVNEYNINCFDIFSESGSENPRLIIGDKSGDNIFEG